jgi:hypothetical protein
MSHVHQIRNLYHNLVHLVQEEFQLTPCFDENDDIIREWKQNEGALILAYLLSHSNTSDNVNPIKTLILHNLPRNITIEELREVFHKYGTITDIYIPKNMDKTSPYYGTIKGFALVKFLSPKEAFYAHFIESTRLVIRGRIVSMEFAKEDK